MDLLQAFAWGVIPSFPSVCINYRYDFLDCSHFLSLSVLHVFLRVLLLSSVGCFLCCAQTLMGWVAENGQVSAVHMWRSSGYFVYLSLPPISLSKSCLSAELGFNFGFGWFWALNWRRQRSPMRISIKRRFI